jgi:Asp/Glu/hydantoin racemase
MKEVTGGYNTYGFSIGILMNESTFPRIPGDLGNATTFDFPVRLKVVRGAWYDRVVVQGDQKLLEPFLLAAKELEAEGVKAITTNCGFLAMFQKQLAAAVNVPVFTSSLMLVPLVHRMLSPEQAVGIMTVNSAALTDRHFDGAGWSREEIPAVIAGLENEKIFTRVFAEDLQALNFDAMAKDMVTVAKRMVSEHPEVGAIVFECTNMAPYVHEVQEAVGLPIFDIQTLIRMVYGTLHQQPYVGHM